MQQDVYMIFWHASAIHSADPPKSIENSYSSNDNCSPTAGENPHCILSSPTTLYVPDPLVEEVSYSLNTM